MPLDGDILTYFYDSLEYHAGQGAWDLFNHFLSDDRLQTITLGQFWHSPLGLMLAATPLAAANPVSLSACLLRMVKRRIVHAAQILSTSLSHGCNKDSLYTGEFSQPFKKVSSVVFKLG